MNLHCIAIFHRYVSAVSNTGRAGRYVALFLRFLLNTGVQSSDLHIVGFSLGAAAAGVAGKALREWGTPIRRITGNKSIVQLYNSRSIHICTNYDKNVSGKSLFSFLAF